MSNVIQLIIEKKVVIPSGFDAESWRRFLDEEKKSLSHWSKWWDSYSNEVSKLLVK
jgi:hypothetical protein